MSSVRFLMLAIAALVLCGCGGSRTSGPAATAAPTRPAQAAESDGRATASAGRTAAPEGTERASGTPDAEDALLGAIATEGAGRTPEPTRPVADLPVEADRFANRLQESVEALTALPGYTYTVRDPSLAPGVTLAGRAAGRDRREWTVFEAGEPSHVIARWVLVGGKAYSDLSGRWERVARAPFDAQFPISFTPRHTVALFDPAQGRALDATTEDAFAGGRDAVLHRLQRRLGEAAFDREEAAAAHTDSLYVDKQGGYLLEYTGPSVFGDPRSSEREITVTPREQAPKIAEPRVGAPAYAGRPPSWRAAALGEERLAAVKGYRFRTRVESFGVKTAATGRAAPTQGTVSGTIADQYWRPPANDEEARPPVIRAELIYKGASAWVRPAGSGWRRAPVDVTSRVEPDFNALALLSHLPAAAPGELVGARELFEDESSGAAFGLPGQQGALVLTQGKLVGTETVNGVRAYHYRGGLNGGAPRTGPAPADLWLAEEGLHVVRARYSFAAGPYAPIDAREERALDVFDAGEPFEVRPPKVQPGEVSGLALPRG